MSSERQPYRLRGVPIVVSAPSGGGKTSLCRTLMERVSAVEFSISYTTRPMRPKERPEVDYHFISDQQFDDLLASQAFLEWAHVHGKRYGTGLAATEEKLNASIDVLFDIDVQGGKQIAQRLDDAVLVFVLPPDMATLEQRLRNRASDSEDQVARRMQAARTEMLEAQKFYTHWIINDDFEKALEELLAIVRAERLRRLDVHKVLHAVLGD